MILKLVDPDCSLFQPIQCSAWHGNNVAPARLAEKHESNVAELRKEWKHARQALKETLFLFVFFLF